MPPHTLNPLSKEWGYENEDLKIRVNPINPRKSAIQKRIHMNCGLSRMTQRARFFCLVFQGTFHRISVSAQQKTNPRNPYNLSNPRFRQIFLSELQIANDMDNFFCCPAMPAGVLAVRRCQRVV